MSIGTTLTDACAIHLGEKTGRAGKSQRVMVLPNPEFAGWLMRMPGGWSKLKSPPSGTLKTRLLQRQRGASSEGRSGCRCLKPRRRPKDEPREA